MAQQVTVTLVDDIDGTNVADETIGFALDGVNYEIDLSTKNAKQLRQDLQPWVDAARRTGGRRRGNAPATTRTRPPIDLGQGAAIRDWARRKGLNVAARGRLPREVIDAFNARSK
jgi:nucleoid-associated protein Lsr2